MKHQILNQLPNGQYNAINIDTQENIIVKKCSHKHCVSPFKELKDFGNNKRNKDSLQSFCKDCMKKIHKASKNKHKDKYKIVSENYRNGPASYSTFAPSISFADPVRDINGILETKCTYCGCWLQPKVLQVRDRIRALNGQVSGIGENRFYCSKQCKQDCPAYNYKCGDPNRSFKNDLVREVQPELRQMVFLRDDYTCQTCDYHKSELDVPLHCHHDEGIRWEPIESADIDRCSTQCKNCHKEIHSKEGCNYHDLKCPEEFRVSP